MKTTPIEMNQMMEVRVRVEGYEAASYRFLLLLKFSLTKCASATETEDWRTIWRETVRDVLKASPDHENSQNARRDLQNNPQNREPKSAGERLFELAELKRKEREEISRLKEEREVSASTTSVIQSIPRSRELAAQRDAVFKEGAQEHRYSNYGEFLYQEASYQQKSGQNKESAPDPELTFTPNISDFARHVGSSGEAVEVRMQVAEKERRRKLEELQQQLDEEKTKELTFQPKINNYKFKNPRADIVEQLSKGPGGKSSGGGQSDLTSEDSESVEADMFTPRISDYSKSLKRDGSVHDRLYQIAKEKTNEKEKKDSGENVMIDASTGQKLFQPLTNSGQVVAVTNVKHVGDNLYQDAVERQARREMLEKKVQNELQHAANARKMTSKSQLLAHRKFEKDLHRVFSEEALGEMADRDAIWRVLQHVGIFKTNESPDSKNAKEGTRRWLESRLMNELLLLLDPLNSGRVDYSSFAKFMGIVMENPNISEIQAVSHSGLASQDSSGDSGRLLDESPIFYLAREFSRLHREKLAYARIGNVKAGGGASSKKPATSTDSVATFRPQINQRSRQLEVHSSLKLLEELELDTTDKSKTAQMERHEMLYRRAQLAEQKKAQERLHQEDLKMKECTFRPAVNSQPKTGALKQRRQSAGSEREREREGGRPRADGSKTDRKEYFDYLSKAGRREFRDEPTTEEKELETHCTFRPNTALTKGNRVRNAPTSQPRGYKEAVERLRNAKVEKDIKEAEDEARLKRLKEVKPTSRSAKPPSFMTEKRPVRDPPLLYMDVNLGHGRQGRIGIYEGDDPRVLAKNFSAAYRLDDVLTGRLEDLLRQHMKSIIPGYSEANKSSPKQNMSSQNRRVSGSPTADSTLTQDDLVSEDYNWESVGSEYDDVDEI